MWLKCAWTGRGPSGIVDAPSVHRLRVRTIGPREAWRAKHVAIEPRLPASLPRENLSLEEKGRVKCLD
jgi:hypothetical protein